MTRYLLAAALAAVGVARAAAPAIPFPKALDAAAIEADTLESILDDALLIGNGDVNALLHTDGGNLVLRLTKNDVWDARIDTSNDPPLLKIDVKTGKFTGPVHGPMPSWNKPYPCPRPCGLVVLGEARPGWRRIRAEGRTNSWEFRDGAAAMSIAGKAGASNGYSYGPLHLPADRGRTLRVKLSGTANAQFYIDLLSAEGAYIFGSKWIKTPTKIEERTFPVPPGHTVGRVILYTWTTDGRPAHNRFQAVTFEGPGGKFPVDLRSAAVAAAESPTSSIRTPTTTIRNWPRP